MVLYTCERCGYSTTIKSHLKKHFNRKKTCPSKNSSISINILKKQFGLQETNNSKENLCPFCNRCFSRKDNLKRHLEKCVPKNQSLNTEKSLSNNNLYQKIDKLIDILNQSQSTQVQHHHYTNIEHQTNIINVRSYGQENNEYITDQIKTLLLKKPGVMIQKLITYQHFNQDHPENQNIKALRDEVNSKSNLSIQTFNSDENDWIMQNTDEIIKNLVTKNFNNLENHYDTTKGEGLNALQKQRFEQFNKKFIDDEEVRNIIEQDTKLIIEHSSKKTNNMLQ